MKRNLIEEAVNVCLLGLGKLNDKQGLISCSELQDFGNYLRRELKSGKLSFKEIEVPSILCVVTNLSYHEALTQLDNLMKTARNSVQLIEHSGLSYNDSAALRSIIAYVVRRNFGNAVTEFEESVVFDENRLHPEIRRYVEGYFEIRG